MAETDADESFSIRRDGTALALSGGGFRATLFHCGALLRLNELGILPKVSRISSVSGGSIASGMLAAAIVRHGDAIYSNLEGFVVEPLRAFCRRSVDTAAVGWGALLPGKSIGDVLADTYDDLFGGLLLGELREMPQFVFNATNLQTGRLVRLRRDTLRDWTIGETDSGHIRLAVAVAASSAFPPVLSPVDIDLDPASWRNLEGTKHFGDLDYCTRLSLTDGGAYDNLGLETVDNFGTVIVSDAGAPFGTEPSASGLWHKQALRALDIATDQARALRKRLLFAQCKADKRVAIYCGIDADPSRYPASQALRPAPEMISRLARIRTRLDPFSEEEQGLLINWGWLAMDIAVRSTIAVKVAAPAAYPVPAHALA